LTKPGSNVREGDYLLAVNGQPLRGDDDVDRLFENTAGKQTTIRVGAKPDGSGARDVTVVPVPNEFRLRNLDWIERNRREVSVDPPLAIYGPKVMIINQFAGSGGDALPWYFRKSRLGPLVGVRTWGGLVGIGGYPTLIDGGSVTAPRAAIGGLHGQWEVEGVGIPPDIEIEQDPRGVRQGRDPQLEAAIAKALQLLRDHPVPVYHRPPYQNHHPVLPPPGT
jgi:C-terminal processing protease CtpA/Prc